MTGTAPARTAAGASSASAHERFTIAGGRLIGHVRRLVREGNARRISIKQGEDTLAAFPLTIGVGGAVLAPGLAALGTLAALLAGCSISTERVDRSALAPRQDESHPEDGGGRQAAPRRTDAAAASPFAPIVDGVRGPDDLDPLFVPERLRPRAG
jgi:hypothetical protein